MAVVIETTLGDITVDLYLEQRPVTCLNFLKLCKQKYYNFSLFHTIRNGFIAQTGDPSGEGSGGESIFGLLEGPEKRFFSGEKMPKIRHTNAGLLSMVCTEDMMVGSQFFFTLAPDLDSLDGIHCVIGEITEGHEVLRKINEVICDESHRPYQDVRITHTVVLEDPYNDPPGFHAPSRSPSPSAERLKGGRIAPDEELDETQGRSAEEIQEIIDEKEAKARATILEIVGDLPDADVAPPENVLFVCKLNPVTTDEDLEIIFSRFGKIVSCEVIRDKKTGDSLQYAFIEFSDKKACEDAYFKMDNVLIDDRRIHVDFSQSVSKMRWLGKGRGVQHLDDIEGKNNFDKNYHPGHETNRGKNRNHHHDREKSTSIHKNEKHHERESKHERKRRHESDRKPNKARSRLVDKSRKSRERDRSRDKSSNSYRNSNSASKTDKRESKSHKRDKDRHRESHSSSHRPVSPSKKIDTNKSSEQEKSERLSEKPFKHNKEKNDNDRYDSREIKRYSEKSDRISNNVKKRLRSQSRDESLNKIKDVAEDEFAGKKLRKEKRNHSDARTPPPNAKSTSNKNKITKNPDKKTTKKTTKTTKKKRKPSTSTSDTTTESSSSSSETSSSSSSSDDNKKLKRRRRSKRKHSSSSSDSSTSSSSTDSSSSESSSSSDSSQNIKKSKKNKKKVVKRSRKK